MQSRMLLDMTKLLELLFTECAFVWLLASVDPQMLSYGQGDKKVK